MMNRKRPWWYTINCLIVLLGGVLLLAACSKDPVTSGKEAEDRTRIGYVLEDNFNFSICHELLVYTGQSERLKSNTAATLLAPDNNAFNLLRLGNIPATPYDRDWFTQVAVYATLPGRYSFRQLPLGDNQPVSSANGYHAYVSRYLAGTDTVTRVNGVVMSDIDVKAGNGYLQIATQVIRPENTRHLAQLLVSDTTLTLFALAVQHSGLMPLLQTNEYTVLAPVNAVMRTKGALKPGFNLTTPDSILAIPPAELAALLKYHVLPGRSFLDRIHRMADTSVNHALVTLNGEKIGIGGSVQTYNGTSFTGNKNSVPAKIYRFGGEAINLANCPAGNGVVHGIDNILLP
ncbi:fasciclin domain-containing protein [Chitinophaga nivalis]|uniref:Fasciclin domain-containing protein n=1 Tax=Chitinophaga nivalis TaxID=2991709 RepID=A0ABT3IKA7_9BACT|nr:fasciclin domain-containing protein [Chitinophaga nivalis]MCW3466069.1 fasciclin domain-containing protein [Chitinophaga nivalis]MCW3484240.1 fasciclin domain-containing protein [Chitinophaga nivalis]